MKKNIYITTLLLLICAFAQVDTIAQSLKSCPMNAEVWPGDANNDSAVDNFDLLPIGLFYGMHGTARPIQNNLFQADSAINWGFAQTNGSNIKHADCNGDSTVNMSDTIAINSNFHYMRPMLMIGHTNHGGSRAPSTTGLHFVVADSSYNANDWIDVEVWVGDSVTPKNIYGLAFDINYDVFLIKQGSGLLTYPTSWFGTQGTNALEFSKVDDTVSTAYGAITKFDHINAHGFGKIADFKFQVTNDIPDPTALNIYFSSWVANDSLGSSVLLNSIGTVIQLNSNVGIKEINNNASFTLAPNPFNSFSTLRFTKEQENSKLKIMDVVGKTIKEEAFSGKEISIEKGEMKPGIYFLQVTDKNGIAFSKKMVIQ